MKANSITVSACIFVTALVGCVSMESRVESTRERLASNDSVQVKAAEADIYEKAVDRELNDGNPAENERVKYVRLTSNQELLLRIVDDACNKKVRVAAAELVDFSKDGIAYSFVVNSSRRSVIADADEQESYTSSNETAGAVLRKQIVSGLTQAEMASVIKDAKMGLIRDWGFVGSSLKNLIAERLAEETDSLEVLCHIICDVSPYPHIAVSRLLSILEANSKLSAHDVELMRKVLMAREYTDHLLLRNADVRVRIMRKLPDQKCAELILSLLKVDLNKGHHLLPNVKVAIRTLAYVKDEKAATDILTAVMENYTGEMPEAFAEVALSDKVVSNVICNMNVPWQNLINKVTPECAYSILVGRGKKVKSDGAFEKALVERLAESKLDVNLYDIVGSAIAKQAVMARLPADAKAFIKERERLEKERERLRQEEERKKQEEERKRLEEERKKQEEARAAQKRQAILSSILPGKEFLGIVREANFRSNTGNEIRDNRIREEHLGRVMGKVITVKGTVKSIEVTMFTDYPKLILNVYGKSVSARMDGMSKDEAAELDPGMVVVVRGIICDRPVISDLAMENCQLCLIEQSSAVRQNEAALNGAANIVMDSDNVLSGKEFLAVVREANFRSNTGNELRDNRIRDEHRSRVMGKVITVKGTVKSIEVTMFTDYPKLILNVYGKSVSARMDGMSKDEAAELDTGTQVVVRGTVCDRLVTSDLALENCVILR